MRIIFSFILTLVSTIGYTQCLKGITTNPSAPLNLEKPSKANTFFDWRELIYDINSQYILAPQIDAPFNQTDNSLVNHFLDNQDRFPEDGWELIKYDMGYTEAGVPKTTPVGFIYVILYNKYTGILRTFFAGDRPEAFNGAQIQINFNDGTQSSALSNASKRFALDHFEQDPKITVVSQYNNNNGKWFYADFNISYDPCTCFYESKMLVSVYLINSSVITLSGSLTGNITNISNGSGTVSENSFSFDPKNLLAAGKKAKKSYKDIGKFKTDQEKALGIANKTDAQLQPAELAKRQDLNMFQEALKSSSFLKTGLKAAPYIGAAITLVDYFVAGGKKSSSPQEVKISPMAINANVTLSGTLQANYLYGDVTFYTPGSLNAQNKNAADYAYYNEVLGVFNLLRTPKMHFTGQSSWNTQGTPGQENYRYESYERFKFQMPEFIDGRKNFQYVLNPASNLNAESIEIFGKLIFSNSAGNGDTTYRYVISETDFLPIGALSNFSNEFGSHYVADYYGTSYEMFGCSDQIPSIAELKLMVNLRRNDADANTQNVLFVLTYPIEFVHNPTFTFGPEYCSFEKDIVLQNTTVTQSMAAWNTITLGPNVTFSPGITLKAGNGLKVLPNVTIPPNVVLKTGYPVAGISNPSATSLADIQVFCGGNLYSSSTRSFRTKSDEVVESEPAAETSALNAFPNPTTGFVTFQYYMSQSGNVRIDLMDIIGQPVGIVMDTFSEVGMHEVSYDANHLKPGVYFYTLETEISREVKRLVIIR
jgi:hypothetical protein